MIKIKSVRIINTTAYIIPKLPQEIVDKLPIPANNSKFN